jgi:hypothetical protein
MMGSAPARAQIVERSNKKEKHNRGSTGPAVIKMVCRLNPHAERHGQRRGARQFDHLSHEIGAHDQLCKEWIQQRVWNKQNGWMREEIPPAWMMREGAIQEMVDELDSSSADRICRVRQESQEQADPDVRSDQRNPSCANLTPRRDKTYPRTTRAVASSRSPEAERMFETCVDAPGPYTNKYRRCKMGGRTRPAIRGKSQTTATVRGYLRGYLLVMEND